MDNNHEDEPIIKEFIEKMMLQIDILQFNQIKNNT